MKEINWTAWAGLFIRAIASLNTDTIYENNNQKYDFFIELWYLEFRKFDVEICYAW